VTIHRTPRRERPIDPADSPAGQAFDPEFDFPNRSNLDRALTWYRAELKLRRLVGVLAFPALAGLTGLGMLIDPGPVPWLMAGLTFVAASEAVSTSVRLRRRR
jgi:hypothetical protein